MRIRPYGKFKAAFDKQACESKHELTALRKKAQLGRQHLNGNPRYISGSDFRLGLKDRVPVIDAETACVLGLRTPPRALSHTVGDLQLAIGGSARFIISACNPVYIDSAKGSYIFLRLG